MNTITTPPRTNSKVFPPPAQSGRVSVTLASSAPTPTAAVIPTTAPNVAAVTPERVRARAYEIFQARKISGRVGDAASDWLQAEKELNGPATPPPVVTDIDIKSLARGERLLATDE